MDIKGHTVHKVMLAETADIAEEYYFSYLLDRANRTFLCIASVAGGMEIEQVADETPEKVAKIADRRHQGRRRGQGRARSSPPASFPAEVADQVVDDRGQAVAGLRRRGRHAGRGQPAGQDARRPRARLDAKVTLDENADFRHPDHEALEDKAAADPLEQAAKAKDLNYVKLDGEVGIIGNGAGLVMSHPRRRRLRRRGVRRRQAGQLPRHRRRRLAPR